MLFFLELVLYLFLKLPGIWGSSLSNALAFYIRVINEILPVRRDEEGRKYWLEFEFASS